MKLSSLNFINFKNYKQKEFIFSDDIVCFVGKNGSGKTNILDAIHYLCTSKSFTQNSDKNNILFGENFFLIQGVFSHVNESDEVTCAVKLGQKKILKKNKVSFDKLSDFVGQFPCVIISPYDRDLISEGSEIRRKWMDSIISQYNKTYLQNLIRYNKTLEQRNALLKQFYENGYFDQESLTLWDEQLVTYGNEIFKERKLFITEFIDVFIRIYNYISSNEDNISLSYESQLENTPFHNLLIENKKRDLHSLYTTSGTHKDELNFSINGQAIKKFGSQGQQKLFLISLKLAQYDWLSEHLKKEPILLLDDVFDKLDSFRVNKLLSFVAQHKFSQIFITDTEKDRVNKLLIDLTFTYGIYETEEILEKDYHE